jgi:hypothetical protein
LRDADHDVRALAALIAFGTNRGARLVDELLANIAAREPRLRSWAVLALGAANDATSLDVLRGVLGGADYELAATAVRALSRRRDGRWDVCAAMDDPREKVRVAAAFAVAQVVVGLTPAELARLDLEVRSDLAREALRHYRIRVEAG